MSIFAFTLALATIPLLVAAVMALLLYAEYSGSYAYLDGEYSEVQKIRRKKRPRFLILISLLFVNVVYCILFIFLVSSMVPSPTNVQERAITIAMILLGSGSILSIIAMKWAISRVVKEMINDPDIDYRGKSREEVKKLRKEDLFSRRLLEVVIPQTLATYGFMIAVLILVQCMGSSGDVAINEGNIDNIEFVGLLVAFSYIPSMIGGLIPRWIRGDIKSGRVLFKRTFLGFLGTMPTVVSFLIFALDIIN